MALSIVSASPSFLGGDSIRLPIHADQLCLTFFCYHTRHLATSKLPASSVGVLLAKQEFQITIMTDVTFMHRQP
jgi:hypothetical protein